MRTLLFLAAGVMLLASFLVLAKLFSSAFPAVTSTAVVGFIATWLVVAALNLWLGVSRAGYSIAEELPIFALIFGLPAVVAVVVRWRFL